MSAPTVSVFLPPGHNYQQLLHNIASRLSLIIDTPAYIDYPFAFTAQRTGAHHFLVEYDAECVEVVDEMREWEKPTQEYKSLLQKCDSCIIIHYRSVSLAKQCLAMIGEYLGQSFSNAVVENGYGCLLRLSDMIDHISSNPEWSWERETFHELSGVADSEWID